VVTWLGKRPATEAMLVGHMPYLAETASELLGGTTRIMITLKRAGVCCISFESEPAEGKGRLEWLLQPRHLRALAR
jgi:phosphohistidine phosphatase